MAATTADAQKMLDAANARVKLTIGYQNRFRKRSNPETHASDEGE